MADVVKIANECRETLVAEIEKLDEFLRMADKLLKYNPAGSGMPLVADDDEATELTGATKPHPVSANSSNNGTDAKAGR